jgi:hypothetical protein
MSTGAIIAIVIAALIIIALVAFLMPRMRRQAQVQKRERELQNRRERVANEHRAEADSRERQASEAEQRARIAQKEAEAERAQAQLHQERAGLHEKGMADNELIGDDERDKFAGTSAMSNGTDRDGDGRADHRESRADGRQDADRDGVDDRQQTTAGGGALDNDYDRGRRDQAVEDSEEHDRPARFTRDDVAAERADERPRSEQRF